MDLGNKLTVQMNAVFALEGCCREEAPQLVLGSHRHPKATMLAMPEPTAVPLRAGSCLFYTGHTFAALRPTPSTDAEQRQSWPSLLRAGFAPSTFFEEELQLLSNPPSIARHYPISLQRLVGYDVYGGSFGYWGDRQHPIEAFNLESVRWADDLTSSDALPEHYAKLALGLKGSFKKELFKPRALTVGNVDGDEAATTTRPAAPKL